MAHKLHSIHAGIYFLCCTLYSPGHTSKELRGIVNSVTVTIFCSIITTSGQAVVARMDSTVVPRGFLASHISACLQIHIQVHLVIFLLTSALRALSCFVNSHSHEKKSQNIIHPSKKALFNLRSKGAQFAIALRAVKLFKIFPPRFARRRMALFASYTMSHAQASKHSCYGNSIYCLEILSIFQQTYLLPLQTDSKVHEHTIIYSAYLIHNELLFL